MPEIPVDDSVRIGKLDNGLTYYLRHNNTPEKKANFYIAQRVGSIQEDDSQQGLAHFLEHMAFNGSEHFPNGAMIEYLQSIGVQYGRSLNAYTAIDRTVYYIADVSTERQSALDSCAQENQARQTGLTDDAPVAPTQPVQPLDSIGADSQPQLQPQVPITNVPQQ